MALVNPNAIAKQLLSRLVHSQGHKVCITGEGSDEVFGGYPYFKQEKLWAMQENGDASEAAELWKRFQVIEKRSEGLLWSKKMNWRKSRSLLGFSNYYTSMAMRNQKYPAQIFTAEYAASPPMDLNFDDLRRLGQFNAARQTSLLPLTCYIIPTLCDRVEMANSVECRTPFLDRDLMNYSATLPPEYFIDMKRLKEKLILKEAFKELLPPFMYEERKHPFMSPNWYRLTRTKAGRQIFKEVLSPEQLKKTGIFNPGFAKRVKILWNLLPENSATWKKIDILMGSMMSVQMLHYLFVDQPIRADSDFKMIDRSFGQSSDKKYDNQMKAGPRNNLYE